jgi:branched-chain amino acid transport system ATP-binding protein
MLLLEVKDLHASYGDMKVLDDVSFSITEKEVVSLVGSNGAGKTSILNAISGLFPIQSGSIHFLGDRIDYLTSHRRVEIGVVQVPEGRRIFPKLTVFENLRIGSFIKRAKQRRAETLTVIVDMFPVLKARKDQMAGTLSGGEQQMLAIARALMSLPNLLMMDEPSLGLAPIIVNNIYKIVKEVNRKGTTIFLVEQNVQQALSICDRAYVLENGKIVLSGAGQDLLHNDQVRRAYLGI